jgi:serine/threonine-protein kinase HipA
MKCHSCLKIIEHNGSFCKECNETVFGKKIKSATLPFALEDYANKIQAQFQKSSIAGFQPKIYIQLGNKWKIIWQIVTTATPTHLLKLPTQEIVYTLPKEMAANEHLTMQLAKQVFRLPTAECAFMYLEDQQSVYVTKFFARETARDFAVLLNITGQGNENYKYDSSYEAMAACITMYSQQVNTDLLNFYKVLIFNILVRNGDAHIRNFSMYYEGNIFCLTPFYDLLCTSLHLNNDDKLACYLYKTDKRKTNFDAISHKKLVNFGKDIGIAETVILETLTSISQQKPKITEMIQVSFLSENAKNRYQNYVDDGYKILFGVR